MPGQAENEWTIIDPNMASDSNNNPSASAPEAEIEVTINTKPKDTSTNDEKDTETTYNANMPKLVHEDSMQPSDLEDDFQYRRPIPRRHNDHFRRYSPSPIRRNRRGSIGHDTTFLKSSTSLLEQVNKHDGMAGLPTPSRSDVYLATYPFTENDVKKWAWLFSLNIHETRLEECTQVRGRFDGNPNLEDTVYPTARRVRNYSPTFWPGTVDIPSVHLSRALDKDVIPEDTADVTYYIVIENRQNPVGSKLLVAESRKAAAIKMYYEALRGDSVVFVGATVGLGKKRVPTNKFKRVESLEEVAQANKEGFVGIVC